MTRSRFFFGIILSILMVVGLVVFFAALTGCQVGVSAEWQTYYPNKGSKTDPRTDRYVPGNTPQDERFDGEHFRGLKGGE